jgi:hypothetical protein
MSLVVIDFTFLEGRDNEIVVKELTVAHSRSNKVSSYVFKKPYCWDQLPMLPLNLIAPLTTVLNGTIAMFHIESCKQCYIVKCRQL